MKQYWWVNHKQTIIQELNGGFLWSPKREANGVRSQFYDNMRNAKPLDIVLSYANSEINHIGVVTDYAFSAFKPKEYEKLGAYWGKEGWLLPVEWTPLNAPVKPKNQFEKIAPHLPKRYSPINIKTGDGNQKAYLSKINKQIFEIVTYKKIYELPNITPLNSRNELIFKIESLIINNIKNDASLDSTEKEHVIKARVGQGKFRKNILSIENKCRVTGIENPHLLYASHIKPWRSCETSKERLDGYNGLLLSPHVDHLFDRGFLSFSDIGEILISSDLPRKDFAKLGLDGYFGKPVGGFHDIQSKYLYYHRNNVFLS